MSTKVNKKTFDSWECPYFDPKNQMTEIHSKTSFLRVRLLIVIFIKEIKIVVAEKHHLYNRDHSFLATTFWEIWSFKILMQGSKSKVFQSNLLLQG